jgi:uncharacterized protein (TIGR02246 family)
MALALIAFATCAIGGLTAFEQTDGNPDAEAAIQKNAEAFVEAFQKGDAKALAACWAADGDYTDSAGRRHPNRGAIEKLFVGYFAEAKGQKVGIASDGLRFLSPDVAIEDAVTEVFPSDGGPPTRARCTVVHVKKNGRWLFGSVRDSLFVPSSNFDRLRGLDWFVGDWTGAGDKGETERLTVSWNETRNFLHTTFSTTIKNVSMGHATHWIGWDPIENRVRSWIFDASGAFGDGKWTRDGNKWTIQTTTVLQDGKKAAATYVLTPVDANNLTLEAKDRSEGGQSIAGSRMTKLTRSK